MSNQRSYREHVLQDIAGALLGLFAFSALMVHHQRSLRSGLRLLQNAVQTTEFRAALDVLSANPIENVFAILICGVLLSRICPSLFIVRQSVFSIRKTA